MSWKKDFEELTARTHSEQGIWWLNGFWKEGAEEYKEDIWTIVHQFIECQLDRPVRYGSKPDVFTEGTSLDEFKSHRILEIMGETLTVVALRKRLKHLDIDNDNMMAISEYLLDKYKKNPEELTSAPQGDVDPAELAAAQDACDKAVEALSFASDELAKAKRTKEEAAVALAEVQAAEAELEASIAEIHQLEEEAKAYIEKRQAIMDDPNSGNVKKGRAAQEKAQAEAEDPLPLRKAKITQKAALRRVEKARKLAEVADAAATQAKADAEAAEAAAEQALVEANQALETLKKKGGTPLGKIWWMERVMQEKRKYMK